METSCGCGRQPWESAIGLKLLKQLSGFSKRMAPMCLLFRQWAVRGGAVAENQVAMINHLGITRAEDGCAIMGTMDTVEIGKTELGEPVFFDRFAGRS